MTIIEFLLARIAEDEAVARAGISSQADPENGWGLIEYQGMAGLSLSPHVGHIHERVQGEHITRWNPARVLAECEAKRRIVELHAVRIERDCVNPLDGPAYQVEEHYCEICGWVPDACETAKALVTAYADHPDYDEAWRC